VAGLERICHNLNCELATLEKLRLIVRQHVSEMERDLRVSAGKWTMADREKAGRLMRTLLKSIEEIAELEKHFKKTDSSPDDKEIDSKQRRDLARRIQALRRRN